MKSSAMNIIIAGLERLAVSTSEEGQWAAALLRMHRAYQHEPEPCSVFGTAPPDVTKAEFYRQAEEVMACRPESEDAQPDPRQPIDLFDNELANITVSWWDGDWQHTAEGEIPKQMAHRMMAEAQLIRPVPLGEKGADTAPYHRR